jgi:hypothetical protein
VPLEPVVSSDGFKLFVDGPTTKLDLPQVGYRQIVLPALERFKRDGLRFACGNAHNKNLKLRPDAVATEL